MQFVIVFVILAAVVFLVTGPLRRPVGAAGGEAAGGAGTGEPNRASGELADLEAAREAKYREIRDAELDHRTGKLSDADYEAVDAALRAEAVDILHELDRARAAATIAER
jgi:hypothetical protein